MKHIPVLVDEAIEFLQIKPQGQYLDGTVGYGGHAEAILMSQKNVTLIGTDRDEQAIVYSKKRLKRFKNVLLINTSYSEVKMIQQLSSIKKFDGILLDLGASSPQFDQAVRGFSLKRTGPLDMRFDLGGRLTAAKILNTYPQKKLVQIFRDYGEEKMAGKIALNICKQRRQKEFNTTTDLKDLIEKSIPKKLWKRNIHPATKVFQALRIEVNQELEVLREALPKLTDMIKPGGRLVVISFHSLEDRIIKRFFKEQSLKCICPKVFPVCKCNAIQKLKIVTKKPVTESKTKINKNVRSRSAKMRVAERV